MITAEKMKKKAKKYPGKIALAIDLWITYRYIKKSAKQGEYCVDIEFIFPENIKVLEDRGFKVIKQPHIIIGTSDYWRISWSGDKC